MKNIEALGKLRLMRRYMPSCGAVLLMKAHDAECELSSFRLPHFRNRTPFDRSLGVSLALFVDAVRPAPAISEMGFSPTVRHHNAGPVR